MWILLSIGWALGNALWTSLAKPVVQHIPPLRTMVIFRSAVSVVLLVPFLWYAEAPADPVFWAIVGAVGILHGAGWVIALHGVKRDYFSTFGMYNTAPLFTLLLAPAMLPERFGASVWLGVLAIIGGGMMFYHTSRVSVYGLAGAVMTALVNILSKHAVGQVEPIAFLFYMQASSAVVLHIAYALRRTREPERPRWWPEIARVAPLTLIAAVSGIGFMYALALDTATRVAAVGGVNLIFGFLLSYLMLKEKADLQWKVAGAVLILGGTAAVAM